MRKGQATGVVHRGGRRWKTPAASRPSEGSVQFGQLRFEVDGNRVSRLLQDILDVAYSSLIMTPELVLRIRVVTKPSSAGSIVAGVDNRKRREIDTGALQVSDSPLLASTVSVPSLPIRGHAE